MTSSSYIVSEIHKTVSWISNCITSQWEWNARGNVIKQLRWVGQDDASLQHVPWCVWINWILKDPGLTFWASWWMDSAIVSYYFCVKRVLAWAVFQCIAYCPVPCMTDCQLLMCFRYTSQSTETADSAVVGWHQGCQSNAQQAGVCRRGETFAAWHQHTCCACREAGIYGCWMLW